MNFQLFFEMDLALTLIPLLIHGIKEFPIVLGGLHLLQKKLHALHRVHGLKHLSQKPDAVDIAPIEEQFFFSGTRALNIDGRKDPPVDQAPI